MGHTRSSRAHAQPLERGGLARASVTAETLASYRRSQEQFRSFRLAHRLREVTRTALTPWTPDQLMKWDEQLEFFLDQTFADGQSLNQARVRAFGSYTASA